MNVLFDNINIIALIIFLAQLPASLLFIWRLIKCPRQHPSIQIHPFTSDLIDSVSIVVPTLNEALRIGPLLEGLSKQGKEVREIIICLLYTSPSPRD